MEAKARMAGRAPAQKVVASSVGAALAQILIWAIMTFADVDQIPQGLESSLTVLMAFALGYVTPPASRDQVVLVDRGAAAPEPVGDTR